MAYSNCILHSLFEIFRRETLHCFAFYWGIIILWRPCKSHFILTMSHWSSGLPVCFLSQGAWDQIPWGVLVWNWDSPVSVVSLQLYTQHEHQCPGSLGLLCATSLLSFRLIVSPTRSRSSLLPRTEPTPYLSICQWLYLPYTVNLYSVALAYFHFVAGGIRDI